MQRVIPDRRPSRCGSRSGPSNQAVHVAGSSRVERRRRMGGARCRLAVCVTLDSSRWGRRGGSRAAMDQPSDVTEILAAVTRGDPVAAERLAPVVYEELRRLARRQLARERAGHTLQATALAHEAYLRLVDQTRVEWQSRAHFFAVAAQAIRRILLDHARARDRIRRGGGAPRVSLDEALDVPAVVSAAAGDSVDDFIALDSALTRLAASDSIRAQVVELRFFGGLTHDEIAAVMGLSLSTVERHWRFARAWLFRELGGNGAT